MEAKNLEVVVICGILLAEGFISVLLISVKQTKLVTIFLAYFFI